MPSVIRKRGKWWIRIKGNKTPGKWSAHPTDEATREDALRFAKAAQAAIEKRGQAAALTLRDWIGAWLEKRREAGQDWKKDRGRLAKHVLPVLGGVALVEITAAMLVDLVHALRFRTKLANRTARNVYTVITAALRDAELAGKIARSPCILTEQQLGPVVDKDPEWRDGARFTRGEAEAMISDLRIPLDRQVVYAFGLLAGMRPGEAAALRWRHYDDEATPLGRLQVATAYSTTYSTEKRTKTESVRHVPVHPVLAQMLAEWRLGWERMHGREPGPDDLIVPLPPDVKRTRREGDRFRGWDYTGKRWRDIDLPALGWRARSVYDTKATFISLVLEDGADPDVIRDHVTHTKQRRDAFGGYIRGKQWAKVCREVSRLRIARHVPTVYPMDASRRGKSLRRRVSNGQSGPPELRLIQGGREVIPTEHDLARAMLGTRDVSADPGRRRDLVRMENR